MQLLPARAPGHAAFSFANSATVIVQLMVRGSVPADPKAIVEVGTFSSDPPGIKIRYENPTRTVSLQNGVTVVKFKVEPDPKTVAGRLIVAASLGGATKGI